MRIVVFDWQHQIPGEELDGTVEDAFKKAKSFFPNRNVMIQLVKSFNRGTKKNPNIVPEYILIQLDTQLFQQR